MKQGVALTTIVRRLAVAGGLGGALAVTLAVTAPGGARAAQLSATPATLTSVFASAQGGDTILLSSGTYTFHGGQKSSVVTLMPQPGALAQFSDLMLDNSTNITLDGLRLDATTIRGAATRNITVRNSDVPGQVMLLELENANVLFDNNVNHDFNKCANCSEGRITAIGDTSRESYDSPPAGITIQNSEFRGGISDGIQVAVNGMKILHNVFHDLVVDYDIAHTDSIQLYGSANTVIRGNFFYRHSTAVMAPDGGYHELIEDNVVVGSRDTFPYAVSLGSDAGSIIRHNTFADGPCSFNIRCGVVRLDSKAGMPIGRNTTVQDNILNSVIGREPEVLGHDLVQQCDYCRSTDVRGVPTYVGGAQPTTYEGYKLAAGSKGTGAASDGLDVGARFDPAAAPPGGAAGGRKQSSRLSIRVPTRLRSLAKGAKLRLRVTSARSGTVALDGRVLPGSAVGSSSHSRHSRKAITLRPITLTFKKPGNRTVAVKLTRKARRALGSSHSARVSLHAFADSERTQSTGYYTLKIRR